MLLEDAADPEFELLEEVALLEDAIDPELEHVIMKTKFFRLLTLLINDIPETELFVGNKDIDDALSTRLLKYEALTA